MLNDEHGSRPGGRVWAARLVETFERAGEAHVRSNAAVLTLAIGPRTGTGRSSNATLDRPESEVTLFPKFLQLRIDDVRQREHGRQAFDTQARLSFC